MVNGNGTNGTNGTNGNISNMVELTSEERLTFENLNLKKQVLNMQMRELEAQERTLIGAIQNRTSINISGWQINLERGIATPPQVAMPVPAPAPVPQAN
jgi:hypothetical protein